MKALSFIGKIFGFLGRLFKGHAGDIAQALAPLAQQAVTGLLKNDRPFLEVKREAFVGLQALALARGLRAADHLLNYLIAVEITKAAGDPLEAIIDDGLEAARQAVLSVEKAGKNVEDAPKFSEAWVRLRQELHAQGKSWLTGDRMINLLIETAVRKFKH